jgi:hypothetical protein
VLKFSNTFHRKHHFETNYFGEIPIFISLPQRHHPVSARENGLDYFNGSIESFPLSNTTHVTHRLFLNAVI